MTVSDDTAASLMGIYFGASEPSASIHHLVLAAARPDAERNAFGLYERDQLQVRVYAIAPVGTDTAAMEVFTGTAVKRVVAETKRQVGPIQIAVLTLELFGAPLDSPAARKANRERKLDTLPTAFELTRLYAAARGGKRWLGEHVLTGPEAGRIEGPLLRMGALNPDERGPYADSVRAAVAR